MDEIEINPLLDMMHRIESQDEYRIYRHDIGGYSEVSSLTSTFTKIKKEVFVPALAGWDHLSDEIKSKLIDGATQIFNLGEKLGLADDRKYKELSQGFQAFADTVYNPLLPLRPEIAAAVRVSEAHNKAEKIISKANKTKTMAQKTAENISIKQAQIQFEEAASAQLDKSFIWGIFAFIVFAFLISEINTLMASEVTEKDWQLVFYISIRVFKLALLASLLTLFISMTRAYLHMREHNLHRLRIANSTSALIATALTDEQKDQILSQLVEVMAQFGNSGVLNEAKQSASGDVGIGKIINAVKPNG